MGVSVEARSRVQTEGVRIDPSALNASKSILEIIDRLSIDDGEIGLLIIPMVDAYGEGIKALPHGRENVNFDALKNQVHLALARELASRRLGEKS